MPWSCGYGDVTVTYIVGQKYPHIYTLSISTDKNQSTKVCCALYIPTHEYNYKVIIGCNTILQEYYTTDRHKCENVKRYTTINSTKEKLERRAGGPERIGPRTGQLLIHDATAAQLWSQEVYHSASSRIWTCRSRGVRTLQRVVRWVPSSVQGQAPVYW